MTANPKNNLNENLTGPRGQAAGRHSEFNGDKKNIDTIELVDTHCHLDQLDLTPYQGDLAKALKRANEMAVKYFMCVCITLEDFPKLLKIAETYPNVNATVGLHPNEEVLQEPTIEDLMQLATHPKVVAFGETGLDYYRSQGDLSWQQNRFRHHIRAAIACHKPLIVHSRQAKEDTIRILKEEHADEVGGIMHCFTEDWEMAKQAMDLNFYISFSGIVTFSNAKTIQEVAKKMPINKMLIETDSPYLAPVPHRGKSNEPAYVRYVAEYIAQLKQMPLVDFASKTTENYFDLIQSSTDNRSNSDKGNDNV